MVDYALYGQWCEATVRYRGTYIELTGHLAGAPVEKLIPLPADDAARAREDKRAFLLAYGLAFEGAWPREVEPRTGQTLVGLQAVLIQKGAA